MASRTVPLHLSSRGDVVSRGGLARLRRVRPQSVAVGRPQVACTAKTMQMPLFPLTVVALPGVQVPLHIYEARYRMMFSTLLADTAIGADVDEGLVDRDSPFVGSGRFGMCMVSNQEGRQGMAIVGSVLKIETFEGLEDGRMLVVSKGAERFKVVKVVREKPYMVAEVEVFPDIPDSAPPGDAFPDLEGLGAEVRRLFLDTLRLSNKNKGVVNAEPVDETVDGMNATELSFWLASVFREAPFEQQQILEMDSARERLQREQFILNDTLKYLSATVALKSALSDINTK